MAGLNAQPKGRAPGIFASPKATGHGGEPGKRDLGEEMWINLCARAVPAMHVGNCDCACVKDAPIEPRTVQQYIETKFGWDRKGELRLDLFRSLAE